VVAIRKKLRDAWRDLLGQRLLADLGRLNPIIRGWANYFRVGVSSETFGKLDDWMYLRAKHYARRTHPRKPGHWRARRYWGRLNPTRNDHGVFGDKDTGRFLLKFRWFKIERHFVVRGTASPDDPTLGEYWWARRKANVRHLTEGDVKLAEPGLGLSGLWWVVNQRGTVGTSPRDSTV
jgi:RNA-directed DNA polymerase